ncbi:hypothetical protein [Nocardia sp. bgisy134]|uniref:hypothetical protein n=1 Tax=unclassified Nocardia TaxID=2637762 RepID=UPI003D720910
MVDRAAIDRCRALIAASGAPAYVEAMIADRVETATDALSESSFGIGQRVALEQMAMLCTARQR